ncbi:MAG: hypothetical protein DLM67_09515 [Candidatus Nephthysia bennettiae]|uniref:Uncharacterized protein n=1 Tax=Candidatus Nephthysia bennettiae TaxID=3127016 RepID=A0A934K7W5_9BACT|nr:hypothetical protein [Candidatus Dormibacteraeota bacterium]MBJ7615011.1 hypothetical protein [Candidatus Dormibacteraeota bacterium]PZR96339.1 MAG: hypothetical protein DLM67_09515 [Candidatus Dormibacteraeota bacterium]
MTRAATYETSFTVRRLNVPVSDVRAFQRVDLGGRQGGHGRDRLDDDGVLVELNSNSSCGGR